MSNSLDTSFETSRPQVRYVGLDVLRIAAAFGVVLLHVYVTAGQPESINWLIRLRDFSLPVMVLSSFFLFTTSLLRRHHSAFGDQLARRGRRLWMPMIAWTAIYSVTAGFVLPAVFDFEGVGLPSWVVYLTGYRHLWYLQFLFLGSLLLVPLVIVLKRSAPGNDLVPCLCLAAASALLFFLSNNLNQTLVDEMDPDVAMFVSQATSYLPLIPLAAALAFARNRIAAIANHPGSARWIWIAAVAAAAVHISTENVPFTKEFFALTVFIAALRQFDGGALRLLGPLSVNSYGIYVLHFLPVQVIWIFAALKGYEISTGWVLILSVCVYFGCFFATSILRRIPVFDDLLPSVTSVIPKSERLNHEHTITAVGSERSLAT